MKQLVMIGLAMALSGCGASALKKIGSDYNDSLEAYKHCVQANGPEGCRKEQAILAADAQRYNDAWSAINGGRGAAGAGSRTAVYQPVGGGTYIRY
jgi:hypothetical protein